MKRLLTATEMTKADNYTSEVIGIPSLVLMERAALAVADEICANTTNSDKICIISGSGNNGADGLACGRILLDRGYDVSFYLTSSKAPAEGSSMKVQQDILTNYEAHVLYTDEEDFLLREKPSVIVDAIFGTGLRRELNGALSDLVSQINDYKSQHGCLVIGVDIPSGVSSDDGKILGCAIKCDLTVTFAFYKRGHFMFPGAAYCGKITLSEIGITERSLEKQPGMFMLDESDIKQRIPRRDPLGHKGTFGKILLVVGSKGMCGAAILCARACLAAGAGMVKVFTAEENRVILQSILPEVMLTTYSSSTASEPVNLHNELIKDLQWADAVAIGSGIGQTSEAIELVKTIISYINIIHKNNCLRSVTLDADALRIIANDNALYNELGEHNPATACILTPHLSEFADLSHRSVREASENRISMLEKLADDLQCTVIGKDARTIIASSAKEDLCLIANGNPGMATAGSGDLLTGITAALSGYLDDPLSAAQSAAYIHAMAGTMAAAKVGEHSMTAQDIAREIATVFKNKVH